MKPFFERQHAKKETRHHLLFEKPQWTADPAAKRVRELGSYVIGARRDTHDYLHSVIQPVFVPVRPVLDAMMEIGREYVGWQNDATRIESILDTMAGYAIGTHSPQQAHDMTSIMTSINAQMSVIDLHRGMRPRYE